MSLDVDTPESPTSEEAPSQERSGSLVDDVANLYIRPSVLFSELPRCNRSISAFFLLLLCYGLYGWGVISTGVLDYEIECSAQGEIAQLRQHYQASRDDEDSEKLTSKLDTAEKTAIFLKQLSRVNHLVIGPISLLFQLSLLAGILFMIIALRGGKPKFQLLFGIATFAALVEIPKLICRLLLISQLHISRVETSAAAFIKGPEAGLGAYLFMRRFDPFTIWFYILVGMGLYYSGQMKRRSAIVTACFLAVMAAFVNSFLEIQELAVISFDTGKP
jgi:hypothetical protein